jgi:hypothetical protein
VHEDARKASAVTATAFISSRPAPYTGRLQVAVPGGGTAGLDESTIAGAMMHQMAEQVRDVGGRQNP